MITATFYHRNQRLTGVSVSGHAGYADAGQDVICASVSASVQLTANLLTEIYQLPAEIAVEENCISISVDAIQDVNAERLLQGLLRRSPGLYSNPECFRFLIRSGAITIKHTEV